MKLEKYLHYMYQQDMDMKLQMVFLMDNNILWDNLKFQIMMEFQLNNIFLLDNLHMHLLLIFLQF